MASETMVAEPQPAERPATTRVVEPDEARLSYHGHKGRLAILAIVNLLLTILTLGLYRFWARTRFRIYFWGNIGFLGDRFEYTGRGLELFLGFLMTLPVIFVLGAAFYAVQFFILIPYGELYGFASLAALAVITYFLIGFATYRARRYRLSRTAWRGIRAAQTGSSIGYAFRWLGFFFLNILTLGLAAPLATVRLQRYAMNNTWFGDQQFETNYAAWELFRKYIWYWLFLLPTFGLTYVWYSARKFRYLARNTKLDQLTFSSRLKGGRLFRIFLGYGILVVIAAAPLGAAIGVYVFPVFQELKQSGAVPPDADPALLLLPVVLSMTPIAQAALAGSFVLYVLSLSIFAMVFYLEPLIRAATESIHVAVAQDFVTIQQSAQPAPRRGEGLADSFDLSGF